VQDRAQQFKEVFKGMDMDGDGRLTYQEFHRGLGKLGLHLPESEVRAIWGSNNNNGNCGGSNNENVDPQPQWPAMEYSVERNQVGLLNHPEMIQQCTIILIHNPSRETHSESFALKE
jgi:Ca2+-binding EF-hand superfamily protein